MSQSAVEKATKRYLPWVVAEMFSTRILARLGKQIIPLY